jgi:predicted ATP-dependent serine protease
MFRCLACSAVFAAHFPLCTSCFTSHSLLAIGSRPGAALDGEIELTDARTLSRAVWQAESLPAYPSVALKRGALVVVVGRPGCGKSTMTARALDSIRGPVLLVSIEEPGGPSLAIRLARLGAKREDLHIASRATVDQLAAIIREKKVVALAIDSVQRSTFEPRELRHILLTLPSLGVLLAVSQVTKSGDIRGTEELRHEADVVLELEEMTWTVTKSRYQEPGVSGPVLRQPQPQEETAHV